ncbi:beta-1:4-galactosyltransferase 7-like protein [Dinothrombium tinctorium]|uniref:Beta-1,4-N-acetylgalactosaminyltransferase n=1 Tax=Dinothrombium tinctorium TaxID=1965070 RepID=A0A443QWB9_9ACAR|nr:beta-1:4-galactosyltransferase 7-like protein [Dinothrombium tinctorium]
MRLLAVKWMRTLTVCIMCSLLLSLLIAFVPINNSQYLCAKQSATSKPLFTAGTGFDRHESGHKLAVIVPFRDRFDELLLFVPHLDAFLNRQNVSHKIYIINQSDNLRFNRASLINVGYLLVNNDCDYIAMHDVDLLPLNAQLSYAYPANGPFHIASPELHPKYHYKTFVGGILLVTNEHFEKVDGMSNRYWGWGLEDDEFYARLKEAQLTVNRPHNLSTGINDTFLHLHDRFPRKRDYAKLYNQREVTRRRDRETGLHNVRYELIGKKRLTIEDSECVVYSVRLVCDVRSTPWCQPKTGGATSKQQQQKSSSTRKKKKAGA